MASDRLLPSCPHCLLASEYCSDLHIVSSPGPLDSARARTMAVINDAITDPGQCSCRVAACLSGDELSPGGSPPWKSFLGAAHLMPSVASAGRPGGGTMRAQHAAGPGG